MILSEFALQTLSLCAISAANQAGELIARAAEVRHAILKKSAGDTLASQIVTEVDIRAQQLILESLSPVSARFDLGLLAEECPDDQSRFEKDYFWCIDPLDGTLPFTEGKPGYAVSIALVSQQGVPHMGVVYDPREKTMFHAIRGQGLWRNGEAWNPSSAAHPKGKEFTLIADSSLVAHPRYAEFLDFLRGELLLCGAHSLQILEQNGSVRNACSVLEIGAAAYVKFPKLSLGGGSVWDYAASTCLFHEAKQVATDMQGHEFNLNPSGSTYFNHCGVLFCDSAVLAAAIRRFVGIPS